MAWSRIGFTPALPCLRRRQEAGSGFRRTWRCPMAQKVQVVLIDDLDGGDATETVTFGLDGATYEIDLSENNAAQLRDALAPWVGNGRRISGRATRPSGRRGASSPSSSTDTTAIRSWAKDNGHIVSERGRISAKVQEAYAAA